MVSFENFVKSMQLSLSKLKVTPSFCFPFKIPDDPTATSICTPALLDFQIHNDLLFNYLQIVLVFEGPFSN